MKRLMEYIEGNPKLKNFFRENKNLLIKAAAVIVVIVVAFFVFAPESDAKQPVEAEDHTIETETAIAKIFVDIGGEVKTPMLAELEEGSRVEDAINAAGGLTENADITEINRAAFVEDGEKIFIPSLPTAEDGADNVSSGGQSAAAYSDGKININTADVSELQELNGVGPATAQKIVDYREENGRFESIEDIKNVSGIGEKSFEKLKKDIRV